MFHPLPWLYYQSNNLTHTLACPPYHFFKVTDRKISFFKERQKIDKHLFFNLALPDVLAQVRHQLTYARSKERVLWILYNADFMSMQDLLKMWHLQQFNILALCFSMTCATPTSFISIISFSPGKRTFPFNPSTYKTFLNRYYQGGVSLDLNSELTDGDPRLAITFMRLYWQPFPSVVSRTDQIVDCDAYRNLEHETQAKQVESKESYPASSQLETIGKLGVHNFLALYCDKNQHFRHILPSFAKAFPRHIPPIETVPPAMNNLFNLIKRDGKSTEYDVLGGNEKMGTVDCRRDFSEEGKYFVNVQVVVNNIQQNINNLTIQNNYHKASLAKPRVEKIPLCETRVTGHKRKVSARVSSEAKENLTQPASRQFTIPVYWLRLLAYKIDSDGLWGEPMLEKNKVSWRTRDGKTKRSISWKDKDFNKNGEFVGEYLAKIATGLAKKLGKWERPERIYERNWKYTMPVTLYVEKCIDLLEEDVDGSTDEQSEQE